MQKAILLLSTWLLPGLAGVCGAAAAAPASFDEQMRIEQKHFFECLAYIYQPALWISHDGALYFKPKNEEQWRQIQALKAARDGYLVFTNQELRHQLVMKVLAESGLATNKLVQPYSPTNQYLTPLLERPFRVVERYELLKSYPEGDALIQVGETTFFVLGLGRGGTNAARTNACLVFEGTKTYTTDNRERRTVSAFSDVALTRAETAILNRAVAAFRKKAASLDAELKVAASNTRARQEFEDAKARANESSPYMEFLLAKAYLEGRGTEKNEALGLQWMKKAEQDGSGDAQAWLERVKAVKR